MAYIKIFPIKATADKAVDYITNPDKTEEQLLVSSFGCSPETAELEFAMTHDAARMKVQDRDSNLARHLIISFKPGEITDPQMAHEIGTKIAGGSMASLINSLNPVIISVMAMIILNEKLEMNKIVGIVLSLAGVYMIIGTGANIQFLGVLISFIAVIGWAFMSVISRKISNKYSALTLTKVSMLIATICNIPVSFLEVQMTHPLIQVDLGAVLGLVYMGVVCTAFTNILWNKSLSLLPANTCSAFYPIQTLTSSFLGVVVFHEVLTTSFVLGSAFIIVGVLISLLFKKRTRKGKEVLV